MNTTLHQRSFPFHTIHYELTSEGLLVKNKNLLKSEDYFLKYEELGLKRIRSKGFQPRKLLAVSLMVLITVMMFLQEQTGKAAEKNDWIFYLGVTIIIGAMAALSYKRSFFLVQRNNANPLEFLEAKPSSESVEAFIRELTFRRREYLLHKFGQFNRLLSYERQYHNLLWLADMDVISNDEYLQRLEDLNHLFSISSELSGFQIHLN